MSKKIKPHTVQLPKGLTTAQAWRKVYGNKRINYDFRGMKYNPKTGKAVLI